MSNYQAMGIAAEFLHDQSSVLVDVEARTRQDLEVILAEVWRHLNDHSSLLP